MSIEKKPSSLQFKALRAPLRTYIESKYKVVVEQNDTIDLKPPYIILSNHVNNWDPIFINCHIEEAVSFVAAAPVFLNPIVKRGLDYTGAISKTKGRADRQTVRDILKAKKAGRIIGLFPEGNRSWNGHTEELVYSTSKLVKLLNIPVVVATIKGGYLSQPRWADSVRKGKIVLKMEKLWDIGELKQLDTDVVHEKLTAALAFDDITWQKQSGITFKGKKLANYLERHLFTCPSCQQIDSMYSENDLFSCLQCGYCVQYTEQGIFAPKKGEMQFEKLFDWDQWQLQHHTHQFNKESHSMQLLSMQEHVKIATSKNAAPFSWTNNYTVRWTEQGLLFAPHKKGETFTIPFDEIDAPNVQMHHNLDFFYEDVLYRIQFTNKRASAYKWYRFIEIVQAKLQTQ